LGGGFIVPALYVLVSCISFYIIFNILLEINDKKPIIGIDMHIVDEYNTRTFKQAIDRVKIYPV